MNKAKSEGLSLVHLIQKL